MKSIVAAGFTAAVLALGTAPASANTNTANNALETAGGTSARLDVTPSSYCGCGYRYVRYYPVRYVRVRYVRYYYVY